MNIFFLNDQVIGPHKYMQIVQARALFGKWKQPVFCDFDKPMTKELLISIITKLNNIGYTVVACVSDMGGGNQGLWKEFGITIETPFIPHPQIADLNIYFYAVTPHLLKLVRNWLFDTGFILSDGTKI